MQKRTICYYKGSDPLGEKVGAIAVKRIDGRAEVFTTLSRDWVRDNPEEWFPEGVQLYLRPVAEKLFEFREKTD